MNQEFPNPPRKKILFIARWYPDRHDSMLGLFIQKHAQAVQLEFDVSVLYVTADPFLEPGKSFSEEQEFHGIREYRIYFGKHRATIANVISYIKYYLKGLSHMLSYGKPDICHVHVLSRTAFPALWLKITRGIPYVITEHWSRYLPINISQGAYSGWFRKLFTRLAVYNAFAVTTVTENLAMAMKSLGLKNKYHIIPNVADIYDFHPLHEKQNHHTRKLVHVSCFDEPAKNIQGMIRVVKEIAGMRKDFSLEIIGDGRDFEQVRKYAVESGELDSTIFMTGLLTGEVLSSKMRHADAFVMFSNYENLPCTIIESLCSGVPVVSTDVGGIREYVSDEFGILVPPGDEAALKSALLKILDGKLKFNTGKMRDYSEQNFSMESISRRFKEVYKESGKI